MPFDPAWVRSELTAIRVMRHSRAKGKRLENLINTIFSEIPGLIFEEADVKNVHGTLEIDLFFWNDQLLKGLRALDCPLIIECKSSSDPVEGRDLRYFGNLLRDKGQRDGILVALQGVTGDADANSAGFYHQTVALIDGVRILIVTGEDLLTLTSGKDLVRLLKRALLTLVKRQVQDSEHRAAKRRRRSRKL
jgi:hypothetical protein